jgi:hypothetical protein
MIEDVTNILLPPLVATDWLWSGGVILCWIGGVVGAVVVLLYLIYYRSGKKAHSRKGALWGEPATLNGVPEVTRRIGDVRLKSSVTKLGALVASFILALLIGAIAASVLLRVVDEWSSGRAGVRTVLATLLLVMISAGAVVMWLMALTSLGNLLNPQAEVTASTNAPRAGEEWAIDWHLRGRPASLRKLTVTLLAEAVAMKGRSWETRPITSITMADVSEREDIRRGHVTAILPHDAPPSFAAGNCKIKWYLEVHGRIIWPFRWWPDMRQRFEVVVLPPEPREGR